MREKHKCIDYECCRCTYKTPIKSSMYNHFYHRKNICPAEKDNIDLTDTIKEHILKNRRYILNDSVLKPPSVINIYNNQRIQNVINMISPNLSTTKRLSKYLSYKDVDPICLDDNIEDMYKEQSVKLQKDTYRYAFQLSIDDLLIVMDDISKSKDKDNRDMNIIYSKEDNKINLLDDDYEWKESLVDKGLRMIVEKVQDGYLHEYERYILKKLKNISEGRMHQELTEQLTEYYKFIGSFDVLPLSYHPDSYVLVDDGLRTFDIQDKYYSMYKKIKSALKKSETNTIRKCVLDILKRNSEHNVKSANMKLYELFCNDTSFQEFVNASQ